MDKQKKNIMPLLTLSALSFVAAVAGLIIWKGQSGWALIVMGALSLALYITCFMIMGRDMIRELKKRFHTK